MDTTIQSHKPVSIHVDTQLEGDAHVLSIQSHVVHGYVGNKAASFVMQALGVDVDPLQVVEFSNHTGYPVFRGRRTPVAEVRQLIEGLRLNHFLEMYHGMLSGYIGDAAVVEAVGEVLDEVHRLQQHPASAATDVSRATRCCFVCDPVLGDNGKFYVSESVVDSYRKCLIPRADVVTPNGFEAAVLSQISGSSQSHELSSIDEAKEAAARLHEMGAPFVVIKSFSPLNENGERSGDIFFLTSVDCKTFVSQRLGCVPKQTIYFSGTGDVFGAALTARLLRTKAWRDFFSTSEIHAPNETAADIFHHAVEVCMRMMRAIISGSIQPTETVSASEEVPLPIVREIRVVQNLPAILGAEQLPSIFTVVSTHSGKQ